MVCFLSWLLWTYPIFNVKEQETVSELAGQGKIGLDANTAKCIRGMAGEVTEKPVLEHVGSRKGEKAATVRY